MRGMPKKYGRKSMKEAKERKLGVEEKIYEISVHLDFQRSFTLL
jgi:hypothetical protein